MDRKPVACERLLQTDRNLVLIGMPGVGKSTLGVLVAKALSAPFLDTDLQIQAEHGKRLHEIIARVGLARFKQVEEEAVCSLAVTGTVIATGGSVIYSDRAMAHLKAHGGVLWLDLSCPLLERRLGDLDERGVVRAPGQTLQDLYDERRPLYERHADVRVVLDGLDHEAGAAAIVRAWQAWKGERERD